LSRPQGSKNKPKEQSSKQTTQTKVIYSNQDYKRDEDRFNNSVNENKPIDWTGFKRLMLNDLFYSNILESFRCGNYTLEEINLALEHPHGQSQVLLSTSDFLMRISPHYNRLNTYYSNMALFDWGLDLYDVKENYNEDALKKHYFTLASQLEKMNLKHEFSKIMRVLPYQDVFYGVVLENNTDYFIQQLDCRMCKLQQVQDGLYNFKINLSSINPVNIGAYPEFIQRAFLDYQKGDIQNWYIPPADKQICIKLNSHLTYIYPLLISIVRDIFDLDTYKKLKLQSARTDNYKAILVEVPIDSTTIDKPLITPDTLEVFAEMNKESMSDDIGLIHTIGSKGEAISFKDSSNSRNNVADATDDIYNSSGVSKEMFNGSSSGTALTNSIENDSGLIYGVYRQLERWSNRYIKINKYNKPNYKFSLFLLDITIYNRDNVIDRYLKAGQSGAPIIPRWLASLDLTPSKVEGTFILQQKIFNFHENMIPLSSSYTQSGNGDAGRPEQNKLTDAGEKTKDSDANSKR
jgi:hypothetical protein